jgi:ubiquinone/menaquinone biosynthesis C-methylase UbiE
MFARISKRYDLMNTIMTGGVHNRWRRLAAEMATQG